MSTDTDVDEENALSKFVHTKSCHWLMWDSFFENNKKWKWDFKAKTHVLMG